MKQRIILAFAAVLACVSAVQAQQARSGTAGEKALLFNFSGLSNLNLTMFEGGLGGKYFIADRMAIRGLLVFGDDKKTIDATTTIPERTNETFSFGIGGALEYHLPVSSSVSPYLGGGITFLHSSVTQDPGANKSSSNQFGIGGLFGVEYFFNQNISLAAEYQLGVTTTSTSTSGAPNQSELQFGFQSFGLTMAVYF